MRVFSLLQINIYDRDWLSRRDASTKPLYLEDWTIGGDQIYPPGQGFWITKPRVFRNF